MWEGSFAPVEEFVQTHGAWGKQVHEAIHWLEQPLNCIILQYHCSYYCSCNELHAFPIFDWKIIQGLDVSFFTALVAEIPPVPTTSHCHLSETRLGATAQRRMAAWEALISEQRMENEMLLPIIVCNLPRRAFLYLDRAVFSGSLGLMLVYIVPSRFGHVCWWPFWKKYTFACASSWMIML